MRPSLIVAAVLFTLPAFAETPSVPNDATPTNDSTAADPYLWLEDIHGARALAWVETENARSLAVLKGDLRYEIFHREALKILEATDRIPGPNLIGRTVYNFWQDPEHVRGLWRRTTPDSYATDAPVWESVLDLDQLAEAEESNWVWGGANCLPPHYRRCLIGLSDGGEDAATLREFDLHAKSFAADGFVLPKSKQTVDWLGDDELILARDWGPGTMTASGYPFVVKTLTRGQALDRATEVFRGQPSDVGVDPAVLRDGDGNVVVLIIRAVDFYHSEVYWLSGKGVLRLDLPPKVSIQGLLHGNLIFITQQDWVMDLHGKAGAPSFKAGSLLAFAPHELAIAPPPTGDWLLTNQDHLIFQPGPRQSVEQVAVTSDRVVAAIYENVRGSLISFGDHGEFGWTQRKLPSPSNSSVGVATASEVDDSVYYSAAGFLQPTHVWRATVDSAGVPIPMHNRSEEAVTATAPALVKTLPDRFDASGDEVDQFEATSSDGAQIPYFVVRPKAMKLDGSNPTILYAYGGFQVSMLPSYSATIGKLWLERGGVYVLANIRGGGEFGPAWHEAGLKTKRQLIYDDFAAVAQDLIARKITSPRRLGIQGGSNGGLLMGVMFNQHPELWRAVDIEVPLLDMLRFEKIGAGASWVGEYGSVENRDERAFLESISPYQNLRAGVDYPEPFFVTATSDDRVTPVHARKMAAKMAAMGLPFLFFENTDGGHSAAANLRQSAERLALEFTYFARKLMD